MQKFLVGVFGIAVILFVFQAYVGAKIEDHPPASDHHVSGPAVPDPEPVAPDASTVPAPSAATGIDAVSVTPTQRVPSYDRDLFGGWADTDGNGCRTRDDILLRDLTATTTEDGCKILSGTLIDPYSGKTVHFTFGKTSSQAVQIDHIVSLSAAWKAGAHAWDKDTRVQFANDPRNLLAVDGPTNGSKSDRGPASWMPSTAGNPAFDCGFATSYTDVLVAYGLTAPAEDIAALRTALLTC